MDGKENEMFYLFKILQVQKAFPKDKPTAKIGDYQNDFMINLDMTNNYGQYDYFRYKICKYRFLLESTVQKHAVYRDHFLLLKYLEILLENAVRVALQEQIATEGELLEILKDEFKKLERKFEFVKNMHTERMDVITNAKNYLLNSVIKKNTMFPKVYSADEIYMKKREEFIYLERKSTRLNSSHSDRSRMPSSA